VSGKGSKRRPQMITDEKFAESWDRIFVRKTTPPHASTQVHSDKTKYKRTKINYQVQDLDL
jgi:hypothetical protein